nr:hypothetical protein PJ912_20455 [Pectobacterium colocasium]
MLRDGWAGRRHAVRREPHQRARLTKSVARMPVARFPLLLLLGVSNASFSPEHRGGDDFY